MKCLKFMLAGLALLAFHAPVRADAREDLWDFTVYLDEKPVGYHRFTLAETGTGRTLRSEARFEVKLLMIKVYGYAHDAVETWRGDCLEALRAQTDDNGEASRVDGEVRDGRFRLRRGREETALSGCVMSFAYWNPSMLAQKRLLNPQTGEYTEVRIDARGPESIPVRGQPVAARRYRLAAGEFQIDLWYADGGRWVALDSLLDDGRRLRYRIE